MGSENHASLLGEHQVLFPAEPSLPTRSWMHACVRACMRACVRCFIPLGWGDASVDNSLQHNYKGPSLDPIITCI